MCGMRRRALLVFKSPCGCASAVCKEAVDEQKNRITPTLRKEIRNFFWTIFKAESKEVFSFFWAALSTLRFTPAEKQNPCMTLHGLALHQSQAEDSLRTGNLFFFLLSLLFLLLLLIFESHPGAFSQTLTTHLPGSTTGQERRLESCFLLHVGLMTPTDLCVVVPKQTRSHQPGQTRLFRIHWLHWCFSMVSVFFLFFSTAKLKKKNTKEKKKHKKTWKNTTQKTILSRSTQCIQNKHTRTHTLCQQTHTRVSLLTAPLEISRGRRFRKIIIKPINRVGKQNTAWQALLQTHTHTHTHQLMYTRTHFLELYILLPDLFSQ